MVFVTYADPGMRIADIMRNDPGKENQKAAKSNGIEAILGSWYLCWACCLVCIQDSVPKYLNLRGFIACIATHMGTNAALYLHWYFLWGDAF